MNARSIVLTAGLVTTCATIAAVVCACAPTDGGASDRQDVAEDASRPGAMEDAGLGDTNAEAGPCDDCMYFPEVCTPDTLCENGPFDPNTRGGAFDGRTQINVIRGRSANDVWAIGALGAIAHFEGSSWTRMDPGVRDSMRALWLRDSAEVALSDFGMLYARGLPAADAGSDGWLPYRTSSYAEDFTRGAYYIKFQYAWGAPDGSFFWCTSINDRTSSDISGLWRLRLTSAMNGFELINAVPAGACSNVPCGQMLAIHGSSANDLWTVGVGGSVVHITGAETDTPTLTAFDSRTWNALHGVWALSETEAWAVGERGVIRRYTGHPLRWDVVDDIPTTVNFNAVWGMSSSDIWAVGDRGVAFHYDGKSWSRVKIAGLGARRPNLTTVWTPSPGHVWIGGEGFILSLGGKP